MLRIMKHIIFGSLLFTSVYSFAGMNPQEDSLFVWNIHGTYLMSHLWAAADTLALLKPGDQVWQISHNQQYPYEKKVDDSLKLKGYWIKVHVDNLTCYVFDGDCFPSHPFPVADHSGKTKSLLFRLLGQKTGYREVTEKEKYTPDSIEYKIVYKITTYRNGKETESSFNGCDEDNFLFYHIRFQQAYHLMVLSEFFSVNESLKGLSKNNYMGVPRLNYASPGHYEFDGLSGNDNIDIRKGGIEISFSFCD